MSSLLDLSSLIVGLAVGAGGAGVATYFLASRQRGSEARVRPSGRVSSASTVSRPELVKLKRALKTGLLEKEVLSEALTRVYEAEADGKITPNERDQLAGKYREQLKGVDARISDLELVIEVGELEDLRIELKTLFEGKIGQIEERLQKTKPMLRQVKTMPPPKLESAHPPEQQPQSLAREPEKKVEKKREEGGIEIDKRVKALRDEVLEALTKLEQMDIES